MGKLSSDFNGCSNISTSSMIRHEVRKMESPATSVRRSTSIEGCCLRRESLSKSIFSSAFSCNDLIVEAVQRTTPRVARAECSFSTVCQVSSEQRSKTRVKTRFRIMDEKVARRVAFDCSSRACGMVCITSVSPSPNMRASSGPTTVVFPPPISICLTRGELARTDATNSWTSSTWAARRTMLCVNSNKRKRGSYRAKGLLWPSSSQ
mmetsp:Transcript_23395/g.64392  ORF Transcript_23395/g.64392 Transcript_23395/m.64392 type:complete len:207 (+) Transcript_23395:4959-5579(+)